MTKQQKEHIEKVERRVKQEQEQVDKDRKQNMGRLFRPGGGTGIEPLFDPFWEDKWGDYPIDFGR